MQTVTDHELKRLVGDSAYPQVETLPDADGKIRCPHCCEEGTSGGKLVGALSAEQAQWFCRRCKVEIVVKLPTIESSLHVAGLHVNVSNGSKRQLLQMYLLTDANAQADRSRALALIAALPD